MRPYYQPLQTYPRQFSEGGAVFQTERYGSYSYDIPLSAAEYTVELHIAELYQTADGERVFNVLIEGDVVLNGFDLFELHGHDVAYTATIHGVYVSDGEMNIELESVVDNATLGGFAIYSLDGQLVD